MATIKEELSEVLKSIAEVKEELDAKNPELQVNKEIVKKEEEEEYKNHAALATIANIAMILMPDCNWMQRYHEYVDNVRDSTATKSDFPHSDFLEIIKEWCKNKQTAFAGVSTTCWVCRCALHPSLVIGPNQEFVDARCIGTRALCVFCAHWTDDEKEAMSKIDSKLIEDKISEIQKKIGGSGASSSSQGNKRYLPGPPGTQPKGLPQKCPPATRSPSPPKLSPQKCPPVKGPPSKHHPLAQAAAKKTNGHDKLSIPGRPAIVFGPKLPQQTSGISESARLHGGTQDYTNVTLVSVEYKTPAVDKPTDTPAPAKSASKPAYKPKEKPAADGKPKDKPADAAAYSAPAPSPAPPPSPRRQPEAQQATIPTAPQQVPPPPARPQHSPPPPPQDKPACKPKAPKAEAAPWRRNQPTPPPPTPPPKARAPPPAPSPAPPPSQRQPEAQLTPPSPPPSTTPHPIPPPKAVAPPPAPPPAPPQQSSLSSSQGKPLIN